MAIALLLAGCGQEKEPVAVTGVTLSQTSLTMTEGDTQTLSATVQPSNADNRFVSWSSSNASVASVQDGLVTAHQAGSATITVKTADGGKTATCSVTVTAKVVAVAGVSLDKTSLELTEGDEATLTAIVTPDNASNKNVTWTSSNPEVATVENGKVTAIKVGTTTITVKTEDGGKTATCEVTVREMVYPVESVSLDKTSLELTEGDEATLTATIAPDNASNKNVTWTSSNPEVAKVENGKITAVKAGTATITVKTEDGGKTATCEVTVKEMVYPVESVSLDKTSLELTEGDEATLTATIAPDNASNKNVTWTSSNPEVATVEDGKVIAVKAGMTTITATTEDGGKTATCEVTVVCDPINNPIVFADEVMKEMCVNAFDTNGDGELSYKEASEVTSISKMTLTDKSFKSFNEFQYFSSVRSTPNSYFEDCLLMESIILPKETTSMGWNLFGGCKKLAAIDIPEGVKVIWYQTFEGCSRLSRVTIPQSVTEIRGKAFHGCSSLVSIDIPKGVKSIEYGVFWGCSSLININLPENLLLIEESLFQDCSSLENIHLPNSVNTIEGDAFNGCTSLRTIDLPSKIIKIPYRCFRGCVNLDTIMIPDKVAEIGSQAFSGCTHLSSIYLKSVIPPLLILDWLGKGEHFDGNASDRKIYVPYESLEAYKTAEGWSEYADAIVGYDFENDKVEE